MTPTREQVIDFCEAAGLPESFSAHPCVKQAIRNAYSAGRLKGMEEAKEVIRSKTHHPDDPNNCVWTAAYDHVAAEHAAAIDQLKEQTP